MQEQGFIGMAFSLLVLVFSVVIHEVSHGYAALALGDKTALRAGRLSLNPLKHIDPIGSILVPIVMVFLNTGVLLGWAKPVPYNPYNLRDQRFGDAKVGFAGPLSNLIIAAVFGILFGMIGGHLSSAAANMIATIVITNVSLAIFNLVPIPPLDGSKLLLDLLPYRYRYIGDYLERYAFIFLIIFALFIWPFFAGSVEWISYAFLGM
jgi:Zn-dependent protease